MKRKKEVMRSEGALQVQVLCLASGLPPLKTRIVFPQAERQGKVNQRVLRYVRMIFCDHTRIVPRPPLHFQPKKPKKSEVQQLYSDSQRMVRGMISPCAE